MSSHPDADAFMRSYLRNPTDAPTRLIFADWLEETGSDSNVAWAHSIRLKLEADSHPFKSPKRAEIENRANQFAQQIRANLTIPASLFVGYPKSLLQLLPAQNITLALRGLEVDRAVIEMVPESVARENHLLPIAFQQPALFIATTQPKESDFLEKLVFILNLHIILVRAHHADIGEHINRIYGQVETETVDSILYDFS